MTIYCSHLQLMMVLRGPSQHKRVPRVCAYACVYLPRNISLSGSA